MESTAACVSQQISDLYEWKSQQEHQARSVTSKLDIFNTMQKTFEKDLADVSYAKARTARENGFPELYEPSISGGERQVQ